MAIAPIQGARTPEAPLHGIRKVTSALKNTAYYCLGLSRSIDNRGIKRYTIESKKRLGITSLATVLVFGGLVALRTPQFNSSVTSFPTESPKALIVEPTKEVGQIATVVPIITPTETHKPTITPEPTIKPQITVEAKPIITLTTRLTKTEQILKPNVIEYKNPINNISSKITISSSENITFQVTDPISKEGKLSLSLNISGTVNHFDLDVSNLNKEINLTHYSFDGGNVLFDGKTLLISKEHPEKILIERVLYIFNKLNEAKRYAKVIKSPATPSFAYTKSGALFLSQTLNAPFWGDNEDKNRVLELVTDSVPEIANMKDIYIVEQFFSIANGEFSSFLRFLQDNAKSMNISVISTDPEAVILRGTKLDGITKFENLDNDIARIVIFDKISSRTIIITGIPFYYKSDITQQILDLKEPLPICFPIWKELSEKLPKDADPSKITVKLLLDSMR